MFLRSGAPSRPECSARSSRPARQRLGLAFVLALAFTASGPHRLRAQDARPVYSVTADVHPSFSVFHDPDGDVSTKEFAFFHNVVARSETLVVAPGDTQIVVRLRDLVHLVYQRSGGLHATERTFGHAWSADLLHWSVDTLAFAVDSTGWNRRHVWSPSLVEANGRTYLFYTGVDEQDDQRIGYASTAVLDTSNTVWDPARVMVWEAANTGWAVPDPPLYSGQTQFRDAYVMPDPEHEGCLLMYFDAHDTLDAKLGRGGLVVGVARSDSGNVNAWHDLGWFPSTNRSVTKVGQLEGPHVFSVNGSGTGWRLMFTNAGSPPGENGGTTIRFESLAPGASVADPNPANWSAPVILRDYLNGAPTSFGWSGSEEIHVPGADYLGGFTAWTPGASGIAFTRVNWNGGEFTLGAPSVTSVDEYRSPARGLTLRLADPCSRAREVRFLVGSPLALAAKLEVFDAQGRRIAVPFDGRLPAGTSAIRWDLESASGLSVASGVYFARLRFSGGNRSVRLSVRR